MSKNKISESPKAGAGLSAYEALQMSAILDLPLTHFGLTDNPNNRKALDELRDEIAEMRENGIVADLG